MSRTDFCKSKTWLCRDVRVLLVPADGTAKGLALIYKKLHPFLHCDALISGHVECVYNVMVKRVNREYISVT